MKARNNKVKLNRSALLCRAAAILLILNILTLCMTDGIFAKFTGQDKNSDIARVAAFGLTVSGTGIGALEVTPERPTDDYELTVKGVTEVDAQLDIVLRIPGYDNVINMLNEYYQDAGTGDQFDENNPTLPPGISFSIHDDEGNPLKENPKYTLNNRSFSFEVDGNIKFFDKELLVIFEDVKVYDVGTIVPDDLPDTLSVRATLSDDAENILFGGFKEVDVEAYIFQLD